MHIHTGADPINGMTAMHTLMLAQLEDIRRVPLSDSSSLYYVKFFPLETYTTFSLQFTPQAEDGRILHDSLIRKGSLVKEPYLNKSIRHGIIIRPIEAKVNSIDAFNYNHYKERRILNMKKFDGKIILLRVSREQTTESQIVFDLIIDPADILLSKLFVARF